MNEAIMSWTDERVEQLKQYWIDGKSASQIAGLLGNGLTRNAVIGKVHRLGLAGRSKSPTPAGSRASQATQQFPAVRRAPAPRVPRAMPRVVRGATALAMSPQTHCEAEPETFESVVVPMSLKVTIVELMEAMCRWPLGDPTSPDFRYCGSPAMAGPYCAYHGGLAYQPAHERRRERERRAALR
jgi:GcrA cell cycle regulator